jgi:hypothetical protein
MSLVVEDGTGLANAESYISVANADARHTAFGNSAWTGSTAVKESALRRATAFMEQAYRNRWQGLRAHVDQALSWPRYDVCVDGYSIASTVVPTEVANACADLALAALTDDLNPTLTRGVRRKKIGPLETEYDPYSPQGTRRPAIGMMLAPFLTGSGVNAMLVRS